MVNYFSIILFFPTVVITYEFYWKDWKWPCFRCGANKVDTDQNKEAEAAQEADNQENDQQRRDVTQTIAYFIGETFYEKVIGHKVVRWILVVLSITLIIVSIVSAIQLQPDEEQVIII
jgi:hypothetical protein